MPCHTEKPDMDYQEYLTRMLCHSFKHLTEAQLHSIRVSSVWYDALQWYRDHLMEDWGKAYKEKDKEKLYSIEMELKRLGKKISVEYYYNKNKNTKAELSLHEREGCRGFSIIMQDVEHSN